MKVLVSALIDKANDVILPDIEKRISTLEAKQDGYDWKSDALNIVNEIIKAIHDYDKPLLRKLLRDLGSVESSHDYSYAIRSLNSFRNSITSTVEALKLSADEKVTYSPNSNSGESRAYKAIVEYEVRPDADEDSDDDDDL